MRSKYGVGFSLLFVGLIALAFASGDISNVSSSMGGGTDRVATVGDEIIDPATLNQTANTALERVKQNDPTMSMKAFVSQGGLEDVLEGLIDRLAIAAFGRDRGIVSSERLIDSEIVQMPVFRGADGAFSQDIFRQAIQQRGISEASLREDLSQSLIARQILLPAAVGSTMPTKMVNRYAALLNETRKGEIAVLPSAAFAAKEKPTDQQLSAYYQANRDNFIRPERRVIRYVTFGPEILGKAAAPTEAEIAARYNANKDQYAASEGRKITQVILPTQAAANAVANEVKGGASLEVAAKSKGLSASQLETFTQADLKRQFSQGVADSVFAAAAQSVAVPAQSSLGWHVIRVDEINSRPAKTLDQVRGELAQAITIEKQRAAIGSGLEKIESEFEEGVSLADVAKRLNLEAKTSQPVTADGRVYLKANEALPTLIMPAVSTAFAMGTEEPQIAEVEPGKVFAIFDVTEIAESAPAPLKEITPAVTEAYIREKASAKAKAAAQAVQKAMAGGKTLQEALNTLKLQLPPVQSISMSRPELAAMQQQTRGNVPRPIALMFNMAAGTTKVQPAPGQMAWFVVSLSKIEPGKVEGNAQLLGQVRGEFSSLLGREYTDALGRAIRNEVGVKRNEKAISAVRKQLNGDN